MIRKLYFFHYQCVNESKWSIQGAGNSIILSILVAENLQNPSISGAWIFIKSLILGAQNPQKLAISGARILKNQPFLVPEIHIPVIHTLMEIFDLHNHNGGQFQFTLQRVSRYFPIVWDNFWYVCKTIGPAFTTTK